MTIYNIRYPEDAGKKFEMFRYPAGEVQVRFNDAQLDAMVESDEVYLHATIRDGEIMGLAMLNNALQGMGFVVTLFLPYLPYARADRRFTAADSFGLSVFAQMINKMDFDKVITLDAHSEQSEIEIDNLVNVSPTPIIQSIMDTTKWWMKIMLPDAGATRYNIDTIFKCCKKRDPESGKFIDFEVPTKWAFRDTKSVLIVDDICDGGGTFIGIAEALKDYNLELNLYVTHGIFSKGLLDLRKYYHSIYTTDSLPQDGRNIRDYGLTVIPCGDLLIDAAK